jgi:DNA-binding NarL/FixJ family response regulator
VAPIHALYVGISTSFSSPHLQSIRRVSTLRAALALIRTERFDLIVVERSLDDGDGIVLAPTIRRIHPYSISILLTSPRGWATIEAAQHLGYSEVIEGDISEGEFQSKVEALLSMRATPPDKKAPSASRIHLLSLREREILMDLSTGATTEEIARKRHNSIATIKSHLTSIYRKLGVRNRVEAISQINS